MKTWKIRLLTVIAALAVVLAATVPAVADDVQSNCDAGDGGKSICKEQVTTTVSDSDGSDGSGVGGTDDPSVVTFEDCFPFCGVDFPF